MSFGVRIATVARRCRDPRGPVAYTPMASLAHGVERSSQRARDRRGTAIGGHEVLADLIDAGAIARKLGHALVAADILADLDADELARKLGRALVAADVTAGARLRVSRGGRDYYGLAQGLGCAPVAADVQSTVGNRNLAEGGICISWIAPAGAPLPLRRRWPPLPAMDVSGPGVPPPAAQCSPARRLTPSWPWRSCTPPVGRHELGLLRKPGKVSRLGESRRRIGALRILTEGATYEGRSSVTHGRRARTDRW